MNANILTMINICKFNFTRYWLSPARRMRPSENINLRGERGKMVSLDHFTFPKLNGTVRDKFAKVSQTQNCQQCSRNAKFAKGAKRGSACFVGETGWIENAAWQENKNTEKYTAASQTPDTGWTICGIFRISAADNQLPTSEHNYGWKHDICENLKSWQFAFCLGLV